MRIVIDLQGAQTTASKNRGIGRYTLAFAQALIRNRGEHEIVFVLNGLFAETIEPIRAAFEGKLPRDAVRVWLAPGPVDHGDPANDWRRKTAEITREAFLASLKPDIVVVSSLFEGMGDDAVVGIGALGGAWASAVILYDLIPMLHPEIYLREPAVQAWYETKLDHLRRADLLLAISESSRQEAIRHLGIPEAQAVNVSTAADQHFQPRSISPERAAQVRERYGLARPFAMYTGGIDIRKNIEGLIRAYALLPKPLRKASQLAIVCSIQPHTRATLQALAQQHGLAADEVVFTGFVPEEDLLSLYNLCQAFVFPSWHEGFGLPALEAMCCGRAVIAAGASSLPELIGREDALFDPHDDAAIAGKLAHVLQDPAFRRDLERHGLERAQRFSWDATARSALSAFERLQAERRGPPAAAWSAPRRPKLAYVSPLPPERSGISDYAAELLPELSRHYEIDVVVVQETVTTPWIKANCPIRTPEWLRKNSDRFDRVLYHFGNSPFHAHMFELLEEVPGAVVLHDFYLGHVANHRGSLAPHPNGFGAILYREHGYAAAIEAWEGNPDGPGPEWKYPCNRSVLGSALAVIVHADYSRRLARQWYGELAGADWSVIPMLRTPARDVDREAARRSLGIDAEAFVVASFGMLGETKCNLRLLEAWLRSDLAKDPRCLLVFVGENPPGHYATRLLDVLARSAVQARIHITGWVDMATYRRHLAAADLGVQLRTRSRGETSASVLDCLNYGLATLVNANGSNADLSDEVVCKIPDEFSDAQLLEALQRLRSDASLRRSLGSRAGALVHAQHTPRACAERYAEAIERAYRGQGAGLAGIAAAVANVEPAPRDAGAWTLLANALAQANPPRIRSPQLFVDVSQLVLRDSKTGIQRVVRSILWELLRNPPAGYRVEPVFGAPGAGYRYARRFTSRFLGFPDGMLEDEPIEYGAGDIFLGLDLQHATVLTHEAFYQRLRDFGIKVYFVVYDLLPVLLQDAFSPGMSDLHRRWLQALARTDGVACISAAVANEMVDFLQVSAIPRQRPFGVGFFHLGADIEASLPTSHLPENAAEVLRALGASPSFLMVGTVEPRKHHAQALAAFEALWARGIAANLVIVGGQGWMVEEFAAKLRHHPQRGRRLFWLEGISDEYLERIYAACTALIAASENEGFGLPLIEAAKHELPILARDIPVFREVAGEHAHYFSGHAGSDLARALETWLALHQAGKAPKSDGLPWLTWAQSTQQLLAVVLNEHWMTRLMPDGVYRYQGSDARLLSQVGRREGARVHTTGAAGCLFYGPYLRLAAGRYRVRIRGAVKRLGSSVRADVAIRHGATLVAAQPVEARHTSDLLAEMKLQLHEAASDLEVRLWVAEDSELAVTLLEILPESTAEKESVPQNELQPPAPQVKDAPAAGRGRKTSHPDAVRLSVDAAAGKSRHDKRR